MPAKNDFTSRLQEGFRVRTNSLFEKDGKGRTFVSFVIKAV